MGEERLVEGASSALYHAGSCIGTNALAPREHRQALTDATWKLETPHSNN